MTTSIHPSKIIIRPRITEKATILSETSGVYVFEVFKGATKPKIKTAIRTMYSVTPRKINIVKLPSKTVFAKGKKGKTNAVLKAYVYLKKGEKIEMI